MARTMVPVLKYPYASSISLAQPVTIDLPMTKRRPGLGVARFADELFSAVDILTGDKIRNGRDRRRRYCGTALLSYLLAQVALVAEFLDLVDLGFEPIDVALFVFEQSLEELARRVVRLRRGRP